MLRKDKKEAESARTFLGKGTEFTGKLIFDGSVKIDGNFKGTISGNGMLIISEGAEIEADICVDTVRISGEVHGQIDVKRSIHVCSTGKVLGELNTSLFTIDEGALFEGTCHMARSEATVHSLPLEQVAVGDRQ